MVVAIHLSRDKIGFDVRTGDFLAMDVHEWHCNTELTGQLSRRAENKRLSKIHRQTHYSRDTGEDKPFTRISFVCFCM
jgi:hypothetical protein